uniref:Reverse transcriptase domain-containing protein n=1 Tax=Anguilla anguilla TaxID=7936 RepID=A0A0E9REH3_ANGAN
MTKKPIFITVPSLLIHSVYSFLSDRPQAVRAGSVTSSNITINTGVPQGCVLTPHSAYPLY